MKFHKDTICYYTYDETEPFTIEPVNTYIQSVEPTSTTPAGSYRVIIEGDIPTRVGCVGSYITLDGIKYIVNEKTIGEINTILYNREIEDAIDEL